MENKQIIMWVVIGILAIAVLYTTFALGASGASAAPVQATANYGGMVGGC